MVIGVETFRHGLPSEASADGPSPRGTPVIRPDGRAAARLRLIVDRPASRSTGRAAPPAQRPYRSGPARGR
jgi:hypothetical protein